MPSVQHSCEKRLITVQCRGLLHAMVNYCEEKHHLVHQQSLRFQGDILRQHGKHYENIRIMIRSALVAPSLQRGLVCVKLLK